MRNLNRILIAAITLLFVMSCSKKLSTNRVDESFDEFYERFHEDEDFQIQRVRFPLEGEYVSIEGGEPWTKEDWEPHVQKVTDISDPDYDTEIIKKEQEVIDKVQLRDSGFSIERKFRLIEGKWFLVYYQTVNL
ncbi:MAG: hypothetical protein RJQ14_11480 [Marinoscillum sp.]